MSIYDLRRRLATAIDKGRRGKRPEGIERLELAEGATSEIVRLASGDAAMVHTDVKAKPKQEFMGLPLVEAPHLRPGWAEIVYGSERREPFRLY